MESNKYKIGDIVKIAPRYRNGNEGVGQSLFRIINVCLKVGDFKLGTENVKLYLYSTQCIEYGWSRESPELTPTWQGLSDFYEHEIVIDEQTLRDIKLKEIGI